MLEGFILGVHLLSAHPGQPGMNNVNPGVYAIAPSGLTVGAYYNSIRRPTVYAGRTWEYGRMGLTLALATGYNAPLMPMVAGSVRLPAGFRLLVGPTLKARPIFHLAWETQL